MTKEKEPDWFKYCRNVSALMRMSETEDIEPPYRCMAPIDEKVQAIKSERIAKYIDREVKAAELRGAKEMRERLKVCTEALEDIKYHSHNPFNSMDGTANNKWLNYCHRVAAEALKLRGEE